MKKKRNRPVGERFWEKVQKTDSCWLWTAYKNVKGYGWFTLPGNKQILAHRYAYSTLVGAIADGLELDHICKVRNCVNPDHLEPVPHRTNIDRARRDFCLKGHEYTPQNTYLWLSRGKRLRTCKECYRASHPAKRDIASRCNKPALSQS